MTNNLFGVLGSVPIHPTPASDTVIYGPTLGGAGNALDVRGLGISYNEGHAIALNWNGIGPTLKVDGTDEGALVFSTAHTIELEWGGLVLTVFVDGTDQGSLVHSTNAHQVTMTWGGAPALALSVDGTPQGNLLTDIYLTSRPDSDAGLTVGDLFWNGGYLCKKV